jgi:protein-tyrosine kinase
MAGILKSFARVLRRREDDGISELVPTQLGPLDDVYDLHSQPRPDSTANAAPTLDDVVATRVPPRDPMVDRPRHAAAVHATLPDPQPSLAFNGQPAEAVSSTAATPPAADVEPANVLANGPARAEAHTRSMRGASKSARTPSFASPLPAESESHAVGTLLQPDFEQTELLSVRERKIGDILARTNGLGVDQVESILEHQRTNNCKFGQSAVALGYVKSEDVLWALSRQFHYAYSRDGATGKSDELSDELIVAKQPFSAAAEVFRDLRTRLLMGALNPDSSKPRALAVVSPNSDDGKSWFAGNLAVSLSQTGSRTLLIDADMRMPRQHLLFGRPGNSGLSGILSGRSRVKIDRPSKDLPHLYLLPVGIVPPNPLELLQGKAFAALIRDLRIKFDHVIVDTPAADLGADAKVVAARCGASLLIGRRNGSKLDALNHLSRTLSNSPGHEFAGLIMNER